MSSFRKLKFGKLEVQEIEIREIDIRDIEIWEIEVREIEFGILMSNLYYSRTNKPIFSIYLQQRYQPMKKHCDPQKSLPATCSVSFSNSKGFQLMLDLYSILPLARSFLANSILSFGSCRRASLMLFQHSQVCLSVLVDKISA